MRVSQISVLPMAAVTTFGLLLLMYSLIQTNYELPAKVDPPRIESVIMPEPAIEPLPTQMPSKPEPVAKAPPPIPESAPITKTADATAVSMAVPAFEAGDIDAGATSEGDYMPIVKVAPQYPSAALRRGIEGYVTVSFTVTANGSTRNVVVLEAVTKDGSATSIFDRAAIAAAERFKYRPRVRDGVAVEVYGVRNRFVFELD